MMIADTNHLKKLLREHIFTSKFGSSFALLQCRKMGLYQVLALPKTLQSRPSLKSKRRKIKMNFNIIVEDSLSRAHFFRALWKSASTLRNIVYNNSIPATVLDFEMFQAHDNGTGKNVQRLFSGKKHWEKKEDRIGVGDFFTFLKIHGYTTVFQEDNCWYDKWGSLLDLRRRDRVKDHEERNLLWRDFVQLLKRTNVSKAIDDFGVTFLACSAYAYLQATNIYNSRRFPNACFAGQHISSLFLNYVEHFMTLNDNAATPYFSYTHVSTSHEPIGRRIANDDVTLSKLLHKAAFLKNTLTIFLSNHGSKSTEFASYSTQGKREIFRPFMFLIIPHKVGRNFDAEILNALVVNQKRLVGLQDLGEALKAYVSPLIGSPEGFLVKYL
ncbi:uncharacterized protein LOC124445762 isoform X1 [Xenia sp. Carnegie-2017]|uniref:uncharacterized protein LOC124445762 isoform X1 n=1 Tax=Xenia sp. Carnegie-2017 TaxID=2897299 RepID=UPI001F03F98E|nr:uncharacterized protein LOC124445762 isoform X1 [Xenia sp. Carnegie-2017]